MQNKPNFRNGKMNVSSSITMNYEQITMNYANKNKAKTKPNKANFRTLPCKNGASRAQGIDKDRNDGQTYTLILELFFFGFLLAQE